MNERLFNMDACFDPRTVNVANYRLCTIRCAKYSSRNSIPWCMARILPLIFMMLLSMHICVLSYLHLKNMKILWYAQNLNIVLKSECIVSRTFQNHKNEFCWGGGVAMSFSSLLLDFPLITSPCLLSLVQNQLSLTIL